MADLDALRNMFKKPAPTTAAALATPSPAPEAQTAATSAPEEQPDTPAQPVAQPSPAPPPVAASYANGNRVIIPDPTTAQMIGVEGIAGTVVKVNAHILTVIFDNGVKVGALVASAVTYAPSSDAGIPIPIVEPEHIPTPYERLISAGIDSGITDVLVELIGRETDLKRPIANGKWIGSLTLEEIHRIASGAWTPHSQNHGSGSAKGEWRKNHGSPAKTAKFKGPKVTVKGELRVTGKDVSYEGSPSREVCIMFQDYADASVDAIYTFVDWGNKLDIGATYSVIGTVNYRGNFNGATAYGLHRPKKTKV